MDVHREQMLRGYLAMLVVEKPYRSLGTGVDCLLIAPNACSCKVYVCAAKGMTFMMILRKLS